MEMWYCERCGNRNDRHTRFCTACGSPRRKGSARLPRILAAVLGGAVLIAVALTLAGVISLDRVVSAGGPKAAPMTAEAAGVRIGSDAFPDPGFRDYVSGEFDTNWDGILSERERMSVTVLVPEDISSLEGIAYFPNLLLLECDRENITNLDLSGNPELQAIVLDGCEELRSLNLQGCANLRLAEVNSSGLARLDFSGNPRLAVLACDSNPQLAEIDLSGCGELCRLVMTNAPRLRSLDLRDCTALLNELNGSAAHQIGESVGYAVDSFDYYAVSDMLEEWPWFSVPAAENGYGVDVLLLSEQLPHPILPPELTLPQPAPSIETPADPAPDTAPAAQPAEPSLTAKVYRGYPSLSAKLEFTGASASSELKEGNILFAAGYALDSERRPSDAPGPRA